MRIDRAQLKIPVGFPQLPESLADELTDSRIALGKKLFYDARLSRDNSISCGSCHKLENAFAEPLSLSKGIDGRTGFRNAQALFNLAWKDHFFRDGGVSLLKLTAMNPIQNPDEMGSSIQAIVGKLQDDEAIPLTKCKKCELPSQELTLPVKSERMLVRLWPGV